MAEASLTSTGHPVVILAGGGSSRFGRPKALAKLEDKTLIEHVIEVVQFQTDAPMLINAALASFNAIGAFGYVSDRLISEGPLIGIHAALHWATENRFPGIVTVPVDTPFLPEDLLEKLTPTPNRPAFAVSAGRKHPITGFWPAKLLPLLETALAEGIRSAHKWVDMCNARPVDFPFERGIDPFTNINTQADLDRARVLLRRE